MFSHNIHSCYLASSNIADEATVKHEGQRETAMGVV
jgi:hypothetical protein